MTTHHMNGQENSPFCLWWSTYNKVTNLDIIKNKCIQDLKKHEVNIFINIMVKIFIDSWSDVGRSRVWFHIISQHLLHVPNTILEADLSNTAHDEGIVLLPSLSPMKSFAFSNESDFKDTQVFAISKIKFYFLTNHFYNVGQLIVILTYFWL